MAEAYAPLVATIERSGILLMAALGFAFVAGLVLARRMVGPIQALRAGAARIGSGDLGQRISVKTGDELEALADQFNDMAGRLQESYADLEKKVEVRTHELAQSVAELRALGEVSQAVNSTLDLAEVLNTIVTKAVQLLIDYALVERGLHRVEWHCRPDNLASSAVAKRLGLTHEATLREAYLWHDVRYDTEVWALLASQS